MQISLLATVLFCLFLPVQNTVIGSKQSKTFVELWCGGDDNLTQGVCRAVEDEFAASRDFVVLTDESSQEKQVKLIVTIPTNVDWKERGTRTRVFYTVEFKSSTDKKLGKKKGACWENELKTCASQIVSQAKVAARKLAHKAPLSGVQLSLVAPKRNYRRIDELRVDVMLRNSRERDIYVFSTLDFGYSASLILHISDASGKEIEPTVMFDAQTHASPEDKEAFLNLRANHFIGTTFFAPLKFLNLTKPGKYAIVAEYNCPFTNAEVKLKPFLGKEIGPLKSNTIWIEVVR